MRKCSTACTKCKVLRLNMAAAAFYFLTLAGKNESLLAAGSTQPQSSSSLATPTPAAHFGGTYSTAMLDLVPLLDPHAHMLAGYDKRRVPVDRATGKAVNVTVYMWPYDILYVREAQGAIKISGWIDMRWRDPSLSWDPDDFEGINETFIVRDQIWMPEIDIFYSKDDDPRPISCTGCPVRVTADGRVLRGYYFAYSFPCKMNVKYFPFDEHVCSLSVANWHIDDRYMDLHMENPTVDLSIYLENEEWNLLSVRVRRINDFYNYGFFPQLEYKVHIRRKPFYYIINLVVPTIILTLTALIGFHMPSAGNGIHQEKVKMGLTTILSIFILQLGVSDKLPRTSDVVPLIAVFYSCMVGLLSMAIVATSAVIVIEKQGIYDKPVPRWARRVLLLDYRCSTAGLKMVSRRSRAATTSQFTLTENDDETDSRNTSIKLLASTAHKGGQCMGLRAPKGRRIDCGCRLKRFASTEHLLCQSCRPAAGGTPSVASANCFTANPPHGSPHFKRRDLIVHAALAAAGRHNVTTTIPDGYTSADGGKRFSSGHYTPISLSNGGASAFGFGAHNVTPPSVTTGRGSFGRPLHRVGDCGHVGQRQQTHESSVGTPASQTAAQHQAMLVTHSMLLEALGDLRVINALSRVRDWPPGTSSTSRDAGRSCAWTGCGWRTGWRT